MSTVLSIIFNSLWSFLGTCILVGLTLDGIATIVKAFKGNK